MPEHSVELNSLGIDISKWLEIMEWLDFYDPDQTVHYQEWTFFFADPSLALLFKLTFGGKC